MRLEKKIQSDKAGDIEEEVLIDEKYEKWFSSQYQPQNFVHTENGRFAKELTDETVNNWLLDKAEENDLLFMGAAGSGKTSLIKYWIENTELEVPIHYHSINPKALLEAELYILLSQILNSQIASIEDLIAFDKEAEKCVIVLDDAHNLFLSDIRGFQCYKLLLECLNAPLENIFWIVLLNDQSYTYLNDVFGHMQQYSYKIELRPWSVAEIRDLIMSRHKTSKRKLVFDELLFSSLGNDELSAYSATADRCFRILWEQSSGNPLLAMAIWVKAASKKERFTIEVGLPEKPSGQIFNDFTADSLFIYSALVKHGNLTEDEAARSTRLSPSIARRAFKLGRDYGFLIHMTNNRFCIHPLWMNTIISFLKNKNYLHGK
jgi:GTPase SAR1 family protein